MEPISGDDQLNRVTASVIVSQLSHMPHIGSSGGERVSGCEVKTELLLQGLAIFTDQFRQEGRCVGSLGLESLTGLAVEGDGGEGLPAGNTLAGIITETPNRLREGRFMNSSRPTGIRLALPGT